MTPMTNSKSLFEATPETPRPYLMLPVAALLALLPLIVYVASLYIKTLPSGVAGVAALAGWPLALFATVLAAPNGRS